MRASNLLLLAAFAAFPALAQQAADSAAQTTGEMTADAAVVETPLEFRTIVGDNPIDIPADEVTPAFEEFRQTGQNPFTGDEAALVVGEELYAKLCQACHLPGGEGRIGPSLQDETWRHPVLRTAAGRFAIIHSGGAGAMQAFFPRISLDEILKVMAYIDTFRQG
ncbi:MAG TPA: c-type cytochrome [Pararhizobium sp.]|nr:c-type cytochrome [Pararhizobium sp.]